MFRKMLITSTKQRKIAALIYTTIMFMGGVLLHSYWALGGTWFLAEATGKTTATPWTLEGLILTWIVVAFMILACILALGRAKMILKRIPQWIFATSCWVMAFCMVIGCYLNLSISYIWSRLVFGPIFLILFISVLILALPIRHQNQNP